MDRKSLGGSVFGGMLLVSGSCIGAGMLALPILMGLAGFFPSLLVMLASWGFMTLTGFLLIEINSWFDHSQVNLVTMSERSLGRIGKLAAWLSYLLLFYSLLVAYIAASGTIFASIIQSLFSIEISPASASIFFTVLFGYIVYLGTRTVDLFNRVLMGGLLLSYFCMIGFGLSRIDVELLEHVHFKYLLLSLPVLVVSFGFQNMIPTLTAYMDGNIKKVKQTILAGSLLTFCIYFVWSLLVLGVVDSSRIHSSYLKGEEATIPLRAILGSSMISHFATGFAFFAIITSFLAQGLTLTHFLADGLKKRVTKKNLIWLCPLALGLPLFLALYNPEVFFRALSFAGGVCAMVLFGILPASIVWVGRYIQKHSSRNRVFGGKPILIGALLFSFLVIACEIAHFF